MSQDFCSEIFGALSLAFPDANSLPEEDVNRINSYIRGESNTTSQILMQESPQWNLFISEVAEIFLQRAEVSVDYLNSFHRDIRRMSPTVTKKGMIL